MDLFNAPLSYVRELFYYTFLIKEEKENERKADEKKKKEQEERQKEREKNFKRDHKFFNQRLSPAAQAQHIRSQNDEQKREENKRTDIAETASPSVDI